MHILIIPSEHYVPEESPLSGIFQYHQAIALKRAEHRIGVITPQLRSLRMLKMKMIGWKKGIEIQDHEGIPVYRYHGWNWFPRIHKASIWLWVNAGMHLYERYAAENGTPDIIHAHNVLNAGILANCIKNKFGVHYVITEHSTAFARGLIPDSSISKIKNACENAGVLIVVSPSLGKLLETQFSESAQMWECIPNILDKTFEYDAYIDKMYKSKNSKFKILNVASLDEKKAHSDLFEAFANKFRGQSDVQLRIVGVGNLKDKLEMLVKKLEISDQVTFLGQLERSQVLKEMQRCDIFVLSSHYETFGVVLIEAMACGKPIIATACGGPEYIVDKSNGILVPPKDVDALGKAMAEMRNNLDTYDSMKIRDECILKFGEKAIVIKLSEIYSRSTKNQLGERF